MSLFNSTDKQKDYAIALLRIIVGILFVAHGGQKLFVYGIGGTTGAFTQMGIFLPGIMAPLITLLEFFGGIALIVGFLTRLVGLGLAFDMLGAIAFVHLKGGFFMPTGYEFALTLLIASLGLAIAGSGALSIDSLFANRRTLQPARIR
jgi:putative oxidoreductase